MKYWSELILDFDYLCNWLLVIGRAILFYVTCIKYKSCFQYLRWIIQSGFTKNQKPYIRWKHFQDGCIRGTLVGYEGEHIYQMFMLNDWIIKYSNVNETENFFIQSLSNTKTVLFYYLTKCNIKKALLNISHEWKNTVTSKDILIFINFSNPQQRNPLISLDFSTTSSLLSLPRLSSTPFNHILDN